MPNAAAESIKSPDEQHVSGFQLLQAGVKSGPIDFRPRDLVRENQLVHDTMFPQSVKLKRQVLPTGT
jgi:hypothetical protein